MMGSMPLGSRQKRRSHRHSSAAVAVENRDTAAKAADCTAVVFT
jgi:hypothetical protein